MSPNPSTLPAHPAIWRMGEGFAPVRTSLSSTYPTLDERLPGGGWQAGLNELLHESIGIGELSLILPTLRLAMANGSVTWVNPPYIPNAPDLHALGIPLARLLMVRASQSSEALWATERALASGACRVVVLWGQAALPYPLRQRLHWAAVRGDAIAFFYSDFSQRHQPTPAAIKLALEPTAEGRLRVHFLKRRGYMPAPPIELDLPSIMARTRDHLPSLSHVIIAGSVRSRPEPREKADRLQSDLTLIPLVERRYPVPNR
jgi:protein ImuA